jgi:multidrug efflux pump
MFARFFIDRPIFAWVLSLVIILIGGVAIIFLPIDLYPNITPPTITVTASYPGASANVVADTVAAPIEQQVNGVEGMMYMSSQSTNDGIYNLTVTFEIGADLNMAQVLVENRVTQALPLLPSQVQLQGVTTKKKSPSILLAVSLVSPDGRYDDLYMSNFATIQVRDELLRVKGVGDIVMFGQRDYSMRIWLDPNKLATRNLTAVDVVNAIQSQNIQVAAGQIGQEPVPPGQQLQLPMNALGRLETEQQFGDIIVKTGDVSATDQSGAATAAGQGSTGQATSRSSQATMETVYPVATPVVRVRDVAKIELSALNYDIASRLDGQPSAGLGVFQLPGSNALGVADAVRQRMEELRNRFPPGLDYRIIYDTTPFIQQSVDEVYRTLIIAVLLVALVVLFFLQDWKAMILPMIDVPVSLVGTFAVMALLGFSLNNLTLFGLVLAIGIVVDDAIVVLENIERLIATGLDARTATLKAMEEITGPIVAITLVLSCVFLPSAFVPGLTGQFYRQFAVTIAVAMIISAINAMTLTPSRAVAIFRTEEGGQGGELKKEALPWWIFAIAGGVATTWLGRTFFAERIMLAMPNSSRWISYALLAACFIPGALAGGVIGWFIIGPVNAALGWCFRKFNDFFGWVTRLYGWTVSRLLRLSAIVLVVYGGLLFLTFWSLARAPTGFIPTQDQGYLLVNAQLPDSASVQRTREVMSQIDEIARQIPGIAHTVGVSGQSFLLGSNGSNLGSMFVVLDPFEQRRTRDRYDEAIALQLQRQCAEKVEDAIVSVFRAPPVRGLANAGGFQLQVEQRGFVDLNALQASTDQLVQKANTDPHFAGVFTLFRANTPQLFVDINRTKVESLQVPLHDLFTTMQVDMGGMYVNQFNRFGRTWWVAAEAAPEFRTSPGEVHELRVRNLQGEMVPLGTVAQVQHVTGPILVMRYNMYASASVNGNTAPGVSSGEVINTMTKLADELGVPFEWTQLTYLQVQAGNVTLLIFALGTVLVYLVLAAKYESWRLPLAVILVVPLCILAAVTGMLIARLPVDIFVQIGLLVLVGLASKNAILIVEFARDLHAQGKDLHESAVQASLIRFRPIIMTSLAFIFGVLPLVIASGAGAEMRRSLGTAVFSGMIGVTLFGIFLTPVFFFVLLWLRERRQPPPRPASQFVAAATGDARANVVAVAAAPRRTETPASGDGGVRR